MSRPQELLTAAALAVLVLATAAAYTFKLDSAPPYLAADETHFAAHASRLATDGTDLNGNRWPVFFRITDPLAAVDRMHVWYQPFLFYLVTATFWIQPVSEWSLRLPVALIGVSNVLLMFLVGRRLFRSSGLGLLPRRLSGDHAGAFSLQPHGGGLLLSIAVRARMAVAGPAFCGPAPDRAI